MDDFTLKALRGSIAKWRYIVAGTSVDAGCDNCPLCQQFQDLADEDGDEEALQECFGCPVSDKTGQGGCGGTPYSAWAKVAPRVLKTDAIGIPYGYTNACAVTPEQIAAAQAELDFLRSLLPQGVSEYTE